MAAPMQIETLSDMIEDIKQRLVRGAKDRRSPMHTPAVASADAELRTMVLRAFDTDAMTLRFHTDTRSPKVAAFERDPRCSVLLYDKGAKVQLRVRGRVRIERDSAAAEAAWQAGANFARRCYLAPLPPGSLTDAPTPNLPGDVRGEDPTDERLEAEGREHFCILLVEIDEVDWLYLAHDGHKRALWCGGDEARWLAV